MPLSKDQLIYMARMAEDSQRYEDMTEYMITLVSLGEPFKEEERNLLSVAFKNTVGNRRNAWRTL